MLRAVTTPDRDERQLVDRARAGDHTAFEALVTTHLPHVWAVVWRVVRHREDAEDVVQEVFLTAHRGIGRFRGESSFGTWLHRIALTRALNHLDRAEEKIRRASKPLATNRETAIAIDPDPDVERAAAGHAAPSPLRSLESRELLARLAACLEKLPPAWRAVVALRDAESLPYAEIASRLEIEIGTVRSRLSRARLALRDCVEGRTP